MKIVRINGGLGNQMFQYAFATKLKCLYPTDEILIDVTNYKGYVWNGYELGYVFDVKIPIANFFQISRFTLPVSTNTWIGGKLHGHLGRFFKKNIYTEKRTKYFAFSHEPLIIPKSCYYDGTWFNEGYFSDIKEEILDVFTFKRPLNTYCEDVLAEIQSFNSISIHVRRGNYLRFDAYKGICDKEYYRKAITYIKEHVENPHFFIFSNDIQWCRDNLGGLMDRCTFVENNDPNNNYVDMQLMSCCKNNIIAHSSFSWWAAWLNNNPKKIVVAPFKWVNSADIPNKPQLKDWVLIDQNQ